MNGSGNQVSGEPSFVQKLADYYKAGTEHRRPDWVPSKVMLGHEVCGDMIFAKTRVGPGIHECACNQWGAISVKADNGKMLGIKWDECEIVEFVANPGFQWAPGTAYPEKPCSPLNGDQK